MAAIPPSAPAPPAPVAAPPPVEAAAEAAPRFGYRWTICALLFAATTINYVDRQVLGLLAPTLQTEIGWSEAQYGDIVSWFSLAYAFGFLGMGRLLDRVGVRRGFAGAIVAWSLAAMGHALASTVAGFSWARAALGLGESGNFPGAIKATAEWFPKRERALATGIFNAGSNVGAIVAPVLVPFVTYRWGWRAAFVVTGALGFVWLACWLLLYRRPEERASKAELAWIRSDPAEPARSVPWLALLKHRQTWAFFLAKFLTDPIWWFYLYWLPKFMDANWGVKLTGVTLPLVVIYLVADVGSVGGGWLSSALIRRGWTVNAGRKTAMLAAALLIVPTMFAPHASSLWLAVAIVSVAAACHQWWSCNLFTTASDMFPRHAVASVVGIGGFAGAMGGVLFQRATGRILEATGNNYSLIFTVCGLAYVAALLVMHLIVPRLQPAELGGEGAA
ncbi:MAG TPA: MFS transporter [Longimicrobium sp.]|nr:MFS transporter [Longimicrobium sp.]